MSAVDVRPPEPTDLIIPLDTVSILTAALVSSPGNPRQHFDEAKLAELGESVRMHGVLQPIVIRRAADSDIYEIVAGERRWRAAKLAGLERVPAVVKQLTDSQVLEIQVIENAQREDVHPLEEAEGYRRLLQLPGYTVEIIAEKIGKSESYVHKRLALTKLIEPLKGSFLKSEINLGHAFLLCRLNEADQIRAAKERLFQEKTRWDEAKRKWLLIGREAVPVRELDDWIEDHVFLVLDGAPWKKDDFGVLPAAGACTTCTKRTGANLALFDDLDKKDRCLDGKCFEAKRKAFIDQTIGKALADGTPLTRVAQGYRFDKIPKGAIAPRDYKQATKECEKPEDAIVVVGDNPGSRFKICRQPRCKHHNGGLVHTPTPKPTAADIWKGKERELDVQIQQQTRVELLKAVLAKTPKSLGRREMGWIGAALLLALEGDDTAIANLFAIRRDPKGGHLDLEKKLVARLRTPADDRSLFLDVVTLTLAPGLSQRNFDDEVTGGNLLDLAADAYGVDPKPIAKAVGQRLKSEFNREKAVALKKARSSAAKKAAADKAAKKKGKQ